MNQSPSMDNPVIVCADDDPQLLETLEFLLGRNFKDHRILACSSGQDALELLQECKVSGQEVQAVLADSFMDDLTGIEVLSRVPDLFPDAVRIILGDQAGLQSAIDAIKLGIDDYLEKPVTENEVVRSVKHHLDNYALRQDNKRLQEFIRRYHLRMSEITDLAFRNFNYHLTRLLSQEGDRHDAVESLRKARENINLLSQIHKMNRGNDRGGSFYDVRVVEVVNEALRNVRSRSGRPNVLNKQQEVVIESHEGQRTLISDPRVMRIVLEQILENASRYGPAGSKIEIAIRGPGFLASSQRTSSMLAPDLMELMRRNNTIVTVTDEGTPQPEDFQNLLDVQEWQHAPPDEERPTLKGLGLVIAQEYLHIIGGHLLIDARIGRRGTSVHIVFPNDARSYAGRTRI